MKRTAIGNTEIPQGQPYWSGGKNADRLRISEKELYSMIDLYQEICNYEENPAVVESYYGEMDKLYCALQLIENFGQFPTSLKNAGAVFSDLAGNGTFERSYPDLAERNSAVDSIVSDAVARVNNSELPENYPQEVADWWTKTIIDQNFYINIETGEEIDKPAIIAGIGNATYDQLAAQMKEGGLYYMYIAASASLVDTERAFYKKQQQNYTIDKIEALGAGMTRSTMMNNINSGIIAKNKGKNANTTLNEFKQGIEPAIGSLILAIVAAVTAIITLISTIFAVKKAQVEQETAKILSQSNLNAQAPVFADFDGNNLYDHVSTDGGKTWQELPREITKEEANRLVNGETSGNNYTIPIILGGAALLLLLMN